MKIIHSLFAAATRSSEMSSTDLFHFTFFFFYFHRGRMKTSRLSACNAPDVSDVSFSPYPETRCHIPEDGGPPLNIIGPMSSHIRQCYPLYHVQWRAEIDLWFDTVFYARFS